MLDFLKNLFKKEKKEKKSMALDELENWLNEKLNSYHDKFNLRRSEINARIKGALQKTRGSIEKLNSAELHNKNIPTREIQFMEGNREAYVKKAGLFLDKLTLPGKLEDIPDFCSFFNNEMDSFKKSTFKPYQILQHFFGNETNNILHNIKIIEGLAKELDALAKDKKTSGINAVSKKIKDIQSRKTLKETLKENLIKKEQEKKELKEEIKKNESSFNELKKSRGFADYSAKSEALAKTKEKIIQKGKDIISEFSTLEKAMKKYSKISFEHEHLIEEYLKSPAKALLGDADFKILDVFEKMSGAIVMDKIELKEKKKEKSLNSIRKLNKDFFESFLSGYNGLVTEKNRLEREVNESNARQIFYEIKGRLEKNKEALEFVKNSIKQTDGGLEKINIKEMKKKLEKEINEIFKEEVVIT